MGIFEGVEKQTTCLLSKLSEEIYCCFFPLWRKKQICCPDSFRLKYLVVFVNPNKRIKSDTNRLYLFKKKPRLQIVQSVTTCSLGSIASNKNLQSQYAAGFLHAGKRYWSHSSASSNNHLYLLGEKSTRSVEAIIFPASLI